MTRILLRGLLGLLVLSTSAVFAADVPALSRQTGLSVAVIETAASFGRNPRRLIGMNDKGDEAPAKGVMIDVPAKDAFPAVEKIRAALGKGYVVFVSEQNFNINNKPDQVAVIRSDDQLDALRIMGTNGINYDLETKHVLQQLKRWDKKYGLTIVGAGMDWVQASFKMKPSPMLPFAREVYKFCPDVVDQGTDTVEKLAEEMARGNTLYLWWD
ncbi:DUF4253 domain-containing protein [Uliginosibacterium sp. 31-16]|uniref:DUF4253 domain-containing protein n=1 Tax=Uliginosibacterium sp. 31-16 TaxID=3068315 RepID=UPI00273D94B1|nr:DUF4253 domain-containing protein [Uliginosibacterium sp. 31-16]MDP5239735.1 DUF4253 domain-containing protein [Uliginosibacterium sp. 31-16]